MFGYMQSHHYCGGSTMQNLLILGCGGYGETVKELAACTNAFDNIAFLDDNSPDALAKCDDYLNFTSEFSFAYPAFGNNEMRLKWLEKLEKANFNIPILIHPKAWVSQNAQIGTGCVVLANACINSRTQINKGCIINLGAIIDHHCTIKTAVHIGMGAIIKAGNIINSFKTIEAGEVLERKQY